MPPSQKQVQTFHKEGRLSGADYILAARCPDQPGVLARMTPVLAGEGCDVRGAAVYGDPDTKEFLVRIELKSPMACADRLTDAFRSLAAELNLDYAFHDATRPMRVLVAVSRLDHCLDALLHKQRIGAAPIEIVGVASNHEALRPLADRRDIPYHYLPITKETKPQQEAAFGRAIAEADAELVVLARYMQILSNGFAASLAGRCINIHHSFLPSFKGAKPYHQAHDRGVKLIGATAHYVTADLDEGPIIEQDVARVTHATSAAEMAAIGREVEASVLARAVKQHAEHRVFVTGRRTVILA
ncbi:MAG: formyltetrahydrofolate deformylase [Alphaproteobacteria bacterium]|nr:formyltetrahydrofolate deformylase [Alphaproteobacteria bacterium]